MGEIAEMMLDGTMCEGCGEFLCDGADGPGYPGYCSACEPRATPRPRSVKHPNRSPKPVACSSCTRRFWSRDAMTQHRQAKHPD